MHPSQRRDRAKQDLRERILDQARLLFAREGFDRVTMRALAQTIGYSATTIYLHFPDKLALLQEICNRDFAALGAAFAGAAAIADPIERIRVIGRGYADFARRNPHHYRLMFMTRLDGDDVTRINEGSGVQRGNPTQDGYALLVGAVTAAIDAGRLRPGFTDPHLAAQVLWASLHGVVALHLDKRNDPWVPWCDFDTQIDAMISAVVDGMALPGGTGP